MTTIATRKLVKEAADNCGDQLDPYREMNRRERLSAARGIINGLKYLFYAVSFLYLVGFAVFVLSRMSVAS